VEYLIVITHPQKHTRWFLSIDGAGYYRANSHLGDAIRTQTLGEALTWAAEALAATGGIPPGYEVAAEPYCEGVDRWRFHPVDRHPLPEREITRRAG
jgi:hypothetical protein